MFLQLRDLYPVLQKKVSFFLPLFQQHSSTKSLLAALQWSAGNWQSHTLNWDCFSPPSPSVPKPPGDLQGANKSPAIGEPLSAGAAGIWKLLPVVLRQSCAWQGPRRRNVSPACLASLGLTFSRNREQEFC